MLKNLFMWIIQRFIKIDSETTEKEINENQIYAESYKDISEMNITAIMANKFANYAINDSNIVINGDNARSQYLTEFMNKFWGHMKKIGSLSLGYGSIALVPYIKNNKLYYNMVTQDRISIDQKDGDSITAATIMSEKKVIENVLGKQEYYRWTNYRIDKNSNLIIKQIYTNQDGKNIDVPSFWADIPEQLYITNVEKVPFGLIKCPTNNRKSYDKYGVPITYGCEKTIADIIETLNQIRDEYKDKKAFVGADSTLFNKNGIQKDGIFKLFNADKDDFFTIFSPEIRDSAYFNKLTHLFKILEIQIGSSSGTLSDLDIAISTATGVNKLMYDSFTIVDDIHSNIELGIKDFLYSCNILLNAYGIVAPGEYDINFDWDYTLITDAASEWNQLVTAEGKGVVEKAELRQYIKPTETLEEAREKIKEIEAMNPSIETLVGAKMEE